MSLLPLGRPQAAVCGYGVSISLRRPQEVVCGYGASTSTQAAADWEAEAGGSSVSKPV